MIISENYSQSTFSSLISYSNYDKLLFEWLETKKILVKPSTYNVYKNIITTHISKKLGHYKVEQITAACIETFALNLLKNGRIDGSGGLSNKSVIDICTVIKNTLKYARAHGVNVSCDFEYFVIKKKSREMRVLSKDETKRLLNVVSNDIDVHKLGILICLFTGIRIGELCALTWENVSFSDNYIKIEKTIQRIQNTDNTSKKKTIIIITEPKTPSAVRIVPLSNDLIKIMNQFQNTPRNYVISKHEGKYVEPRTMQNKFKNYLAEANIDDANFHALRHTFATRCIEVGCDPKTLSELLGHSSVKITLDRYVHTSMDQKRDSINKLSYYI